MEHYNFIATNEIITVNFKEVAEFVESFPDFQTVALKDDNELIVLLDLISISEIEQKELNNSNYSTYWDLSSHRLPELNEDEFDHLFSSCLLYTSPSPRDRG